MILIVYGYFVFRLAVFKIIRTPENHVALIVRYKSKRGHGFSRFVVSFRNFCLRFLIGPDCRNVIK